jgi:hypothetical protein
MELSEIESDFRVKVKSYRYEKVVDSDDDGKYYGLNIHRLWRK